MHQIFAIPITQTTRIQGAKEFVKYAMEDKGHFFAATPNAEILLEAEKNPKLKKFLKSCVLTFADSVSLQWAVEAKIKRWSRLRSFFELIFLPLRKRRWKTIPERICGSDIFEDICAKSAEKAVRIFLLGGLDGVAKETQKILKEKYPKIKIVGVSEKSPTDDSLLGDLNKAKPQIIFVAYGCPKQELWIAKNLKKIPTARIAMGIGGTFDFVVGKITRAPKSFQKLGLEWLWRLYKEPKRFRRIFNAVVVFPFRILSV